MITQFDFQAAPDSPVFMLRVPDPLECAPARAFITGGKYQLHPTLQMLTEHDRDVGDDRFDSGRVTIRSIEPPNLATWNRKQITFHDRSQKTSRTQTGESHHEFHHYMELEVDPNVIDFQMHGIHILREQDEEKEESFPDTVLLMADGQVIVDEVKASRSYFLEPGYRRKMDRLRCDLAKVGIEFREIDRSDQPQLRRRRYNILRAYHDRYTYYSSAQRDSVHERIAAGGGATTMAKVEDALDVHHTVRRMIVNAMLSRRDLAFDLNSQVTAETLVTMAPAVSPDLTDIRRIFHRLG